MQDIINQSLIIIPAVVGGITVIWLIILTVLFLNLNKHYNHLVSKVKKKNLQEILDIILKQQKLQAEDIDKLKTQIQVLEKDDTFHFQQIGFLRFNPFSDTGGDQSFVLALLDEHKNGIVFSSLHNRDQTRVYAKKVQKGQETDMPFSEEEKQVIASAQKFQA